jgi:hypothetical protein
MEKTVTSIDVSPPPLDWERPDPGRPRHYRSVGTAAIFPSGDERQKLPPLYDCSSPVWSKGW